MQRREEGQAAVLAVGLVFLFLIIAAVALDVGWWLHDKRDAQNDVDAAALAGAQDLPDEGAASATAMMWATLNDVASGDLQPLEFEDRTGDGLADLIRARIERDPGSLENGLLDIGIVTVRAKAAAARMRAVASCVMPWAVLGDPAQGPGGKWGLTSCEQDPTCDPYIFHMSEFDTPGNFGALALYGNGAIDYKQAIYSECGSGTEGACDQADPEVCVGCTLDCEVKTGSMGENTDDALTQRDNNNQAGTWCDVTTYQQAKDMMDTDTHPECGDARAVLIPIISDPPGWPQGHSGPIDILGIATFYIASWDRDPPYGNVDVDGDTIEDDAMVWGYFMEGGKLMPAWDMQWGYSDDPFAPISVVLVE